MGWGRHRFSCLMFSTETIFKKKTKKKQHTHTQEAIISFCLRLASKMFFKIFIYIHMISLYLFLNSLAAYNPLEANQNKICTLRNIRQTLVSVLGCKIMYLSLKS